MDHAAQEYKKNMCNSTKHYANEKSKLNRTVCLKNNVVF